MINGSVLWKNNICFRILGELHLNENSHNSISCTKNPVTGCRNHIICWFSVAVESATLAYDCERVGECVCELLYMQRIYLFLHVWTLSCWTCVGELERWKDCRTRWNPKYFVLFVGDCAYLMHHYFGNVPTVNCWKLLDLKGNIFHHWPDWMNQWVCIISSFVWRCGFCLCAFLFTAPTHNIRVK